MIKVNDVRRTVPPESLQPFSPSFDRRTCLLPPASSNFYQAPVLVMPRCNMRQAPFRSLHPGDRHGKCVVSLYRGQVADMGMKGIHLFDVMLGVPLNTRTVCHERIYERRST
jgi:hypothetical protein